MDRVVWLSLPDIQTEANALAKGEVDYVQTVYPDVVQTLQGQQGCGHPETGQHHHADAAA